MGVHSTSTDALRTPPCPARCPPSAIRALAFIADVARPSSAGACRLERRLASLRAHAHPVFNLVGVGPSGSLTIGTLGTYAVRVRRLPPLRLERHSESPALEDWQTWAARQDRPLAIDLFCGAGGLSYGLERAGFRVALAVDTDPWALETHEHNFPGPALNADLGVREHLDDVVAMLRGTEIALVAGGPPCQPFSRAGRSKIRSLIEAGRDPVDPRRELWRAFLTVVEEARPAAVLLENVPDLALGDDVTVVRLMAERLEQLGYETYWRLVEAWQHGVPQHRQRFILVAIQGGAAFSWPEVETREVTLRDAIGDLPPLGDSTGEMEMPYDGPLTDFQRLARSGVESDRMDVVYDHHTRAVRADDREAFEHMDERTRYSDLPQHLRRYRDDIFDDKYKRLGWGELSRSITAHLAKDGYWYIHPEEHRTITVREAARIQTFPDEYRFAGTRSHAFRQIGNAVPPQLARLIGERIMAALATTPVDPPSRSSQRVRRAREALLQWAAGDRRAAPWRYPGDAWAVAVGRLLAPRTDTQGPVATFLSNWPTAERWTNDPQRWAGAEELDIKNPTFVCLVLDAVAEAAADGGWRDGGDVSAPLAAADRAWLLGVGLNDGSLVSGTGILRVLSRFFDEPTLMSRRGSDGKLALARFVGAGAQAADLNAGLHGLSRTVCATKAPRCASCPLMSTCAVGGALLGGEGAG